MNWLPAIAFALTLGAPGSKDAPKKAEPPSLVGEWQCVEFVGGGRVVGPGEVGQMIIEFTADGKFRSRWGRDESDGTYTTDAAKDPAELNSVSAKNGKVAQLIYKVEKEKLILCGAEGGGERPTKFESPAGTRVMLLTYKRVEKKKE